MFEGSLHHSDQPKGHVIDGKLFVARSERAVFLVPSDHPLDDVPSPIQRLIESLVARLVLACWDHRADPPLPAPPADAWVAVALVPRQVIRPTSTTRPTMEQSPRHSRLERRAVVCLSGRNVDRDDPTMLITNQVDLGRKPATRAAERMVKGLLHLRRLTPAQPLRTRFARSGMASFFSPLRQQRDSLGRQSRRYTRDRGRSPPDRPVRQAAR